LVFFAGPLAAEEKEKGESKAEMTLKERRAPPTAEAIDPNATIDALLTKKAQSDWSNAKGARIEGYVVQVEREDDGDVHLAVAASANQTDSAKWMIVEVTPAWQKRKPELSVKRLRALVKKHVRVTGWLYYEPEEDQEDPRGTRWELHPVTELAVLD
jgi:hypothetical protein